MFINNTTVRVNDRGFKLEETYFQDTVDMLNNDYDSALMTGTYNDFGREKKRNIKPSPVRFNLELRVEEWKINLYTEVDEIISDKKIRAEQKLIMFFDFIYCILATTFFR